MELHGSNSGNRPFPRKGPSSAAQHCLYIQPILMWFLSAGLSSFELNQNGLTLQKHYLPNSPDDHHAVWSAYI